MRWVGTVAAIIVRSDPKKGFNRGWARITRIKDDGDAEIWLSESQKALWWPKLLHIRTHPRPSAVESPYESGFVSRSALFRLGSSYDPALGVSQ